MFFLTIINDSFSYAFLNFFLIVSVSFLNIPSLLKREPRELMMHISAGKHDKGLFQATERSRYRCLREKMYQVVTNLNAANLQI